MTREMTEWPSECGPIAIIMQSDGGKGYSFLCGGTVVRFSSIWMLSGEGRPKWSSGKSRFRRAGGDPTLVADDSLHPSGKMYTPWADAIVPLAELALIKAEYS